MICDFCSFKCDIDKNKYGICGLRYYNGDEIISINYGKVIAENVDPIEKKPLFHFYPGSMIYSIGVPGCNFKCKFCQNYQISQKEEFNKVLKNIPKTGPEMIIEKAKKYSAIAYTYSEPTVWLDYLLDIAKKAKKDEIKNVMVTNGFFSEKSCNLLIKYIDGFNIDLKGDNNFYTKYCNGTLNPVLDNIERISNAGIHIEVTTLIIEEIHDLEQISFLAKQLEKRNIKVWHISRFFPTYKMKNYKPTSEQYIKEVYDYIIKNFNIDFVYVGNSRQYELQNTYCPFCNEEVIIRKYFVKSNLSNNECPNCGKPLYGRL